MKMVLHVTNDFFMVLRVCSLLFHFIGHQKPSKSYNFSFFLFFRVCFESKLFFKRDFEEKFFSLWLKLIISHDIFPTSNGQTLKSFNLKGKSWENKILRMAEVGENIQFWQKNQQNCWKLMKMALHVINDFSMALSAFFYCYLTFLGTKSCQNCTIFHFLIFRGMFWAKIGS